MRFLILFLILVVTANANSQYDSQGLDDSPFLTQAEADFLNVLLQDTRGDFDFHNKKAIFVTGVQEII